MEMPNVRCSDQQWGEFWKAVLETWPRWKHTVTNARDWRDALQQFPYEVLMLVRRQQVTRFAGDDPKLSRFLDGCDGVMGPVREARAEDGYEMVADVPGRAEVCGVIARWRAEEPDAVAREALSCRLQRPECRLGAPPNLDDCSTWNDGLLIAVWLRWHAANDKAVPMKRVARQPEPAPGSSVTLDEFIDLNPDGFFARLRDRRTRGVIEDEDEASVADVLFGE